MEKSNNQNTMLMALIIVVGFAAGYLCYSQFIKPSLNPPPPPPISARDNLKSFQNMSINFSILDNNNFKSLNIYGELPVNPGVTGKKDIFAPF